MQSLIVLLNFACSAVRPGRAFLRQLIDLTVNVKSPFHYVQLHNPVKKDLRVWLSFLSQFNGKSFFIDDVWQNSNHLSLLLMPLGLWVLGLFSKATVATANGLFSGHHRILQHSSYI